MTSKSPTTRPVLSFIFVFILLLSSSNLRVESNQAVVPLQITVVGKLVLTHANNDNNNGAGSTLNVPLRLVPGFMNPTLAGSSSVRIRTNMKSWQLAAQRTIEALSTNIDPEDISLSFTLQSGSKADPKIAKLISPFNEQTDLSSISTTSQTPILSGNGITSIARDPQNLDNWLQLTSNYSASPDSFRDNNEWNTIVSYSLVSP